MVILHFKEQAISLSVFNPSLCRCCHFILSHAPVSRPCRLSLFYPDRASLDRPNQDLSHMDGPLLRTERFSYDLEKWFR